MTMKEMLPNLPEENIGELHFSSNIRLNFGMGVSRADYFSRKKLITPQILSKNKLIYAQSFL